MKKNATVPIKAKNMMYTQQIEYLPEGDFDNLIDTIKSKLQPKKYAGIVHDKDLDDHGKSEANHVHVMLSFENARSVHSVAKILNDKPQYIEAWEGSSGNGYAYLIHATDSAKNKYQYKPTEVRANFDYLAELQKIKQDIKRAKGDAETKILLDALYDGLISRKDIEAKLTGSQYGKLKKQIDNIWAKALQKNADKWRTEMLEKNQSIEVIWIYGFAGTGKSSFAKDYAKRKKREYFISGSSRDIFQGYEGERTIILDELRATSIQYSDLLRITDPFGADAQVMAPSRYYDKPLACDLIIITSPYSPIDFYIQLYGDENYRVHFHSQIDSFEQLYRRITLTIKMTPTSIFCADWDRKYDVYKCDSETEKVNTYSALAREGQRIEPLEIYNSIFEEGCDEDGTES